MVIVAWKGKEGGEIGGDFAVDVRARANGRPPVGHGMCLEHHCFWTLINDGPRAEIIGRRPNYEIISSCIKGWIWIFTLDLLIWIDEMEDKAYD